MEVAAVAHPQVVAEPQEVYGGVWTLRKLNILSKYLDMYTRALKGQRFKLVYIDAFAGTGQVPIPTHAEDFIDDPVVFIDGSATIALKITDKKFDRLIFIESDPKYCASLEKIRQENPDRDIRIENWDANSFLRDRLQMNWAQWRGVLFLDPYSMQVEWSTLEKVARLHALDIWVLVPLSSVARNLPLSGTQVEIFEKPAKLMKRFFGDESWKKLYKPSPQLSFFDDEVYQRVSGVDGIQKIYKENLYRLFGDRFLGESIVFRNLKESPLFEFMFCAGSSRGVNLAKRFVEYVLRSM